MKVFNQRMAESSEAKRSRLVLALDVTGPLDQRLAKAERVLARVQGSVAAVKLNHHLILPFGLKGLEPLVRSCKKARLPLIADLKMNDIESTNLDAIETLSSFGFDGVIANPFVGYERGLGKVLERAHARGLGVLLLVYMSHEGAKDGYALHDERGEPLYRIFASRAKQWGADGVIVSAKSSAIIAEVREIVGKESSIFSPGVGAQGGKAETAVESGADFLIVGRSVVEAAAPALAVRELNTLGS